MLADFVLAVHFLFVLFVVAGLVLIWIGAARGWRWVRNFWFRAAHLAAIVFVAGEAITGVTCPLTLWEDALRGGSDGTSFIGRWLSRLLYYNFPEWVFTIAYVSFALVVVWTYWRIKPEKRGA
jgi:hypothetical protein